MATRQELANALRALVMDAVQKANSGHPGMPLGAAPMAHVLWTRYLRFDPSRPELHYMRGPGPKWRAKHAHGAGSAS